jgi:hypothetical protein
MTRALLLAVVLAASPREKPRGFGFMPPLTNNGRIRLCRKICKGSDFEVTLPIRGWGPGTHKKESRSFSCLCRWRNP